MEKTIRELATELDISKEAIYRKVNHSMKAELINHVVKRDGKTYITGIGQSIIFQSLKREIDEIQIEQASILNDKDKVNNVETAVTLEYVYHLKKQIDLLETRYDNEINNNSRERETLYQLNQSLIDMLSREQHLQLVNKQLLLQTIRPEYVNEPPEPDVPKGFFHRIFRKDKRFHR